MGAATRGHQISANKLSDGLADAIKSLGIDWGENTPPTFHELRSLAEREYKKVGINTQYLLGHKHQKTTDNYADARGHDWIIVEANNG
ncbi:MAG: tyrosine-type recombinase/integrase [Amphritea sp.]